MAPKAKLLTIQDVAAILAVSERTVRKLYRDGKLAKPKKVGGRLARWSNSDVKDYLARWRTGNG